MKILAVADIHGAQYRLNLILDNIEKYLPDLVVICGDITQFGPSDVALNFLNQIPIKTFAIPGNIDPVDVNDAIDKSNAENIELKKTEFNKTPFVGFSGVNQINEFVKNIISNLLDDKCIFVTHVPPYKAQDKVFLGKNAGSREIRDFIEEYQPRLVLCGHIHEDPGYSYIKKIPVVNCSMGKRGEGAIIEINKKVKIRML